MAMAPVAEHAAGGLELGLVLGEDPLSENYGDATYHWVVIEVDEFTEIPLLTEALKDQRVFIQGTLISFPIIVGNDEVILELREGRGTVQCVVRVQPGVVSQQMVQYAAGFISCSVFAIEGVVSVPSSPVQGTTQQVQVQVLKLYCLAD